MDVKQKYFTTSGALSERDWALTDYVTTNFVKSLATLFPLSFDGLSSLNHSTENPQIGLPQARVLGCRGDKGYTLPSYFRTICFNLFPEHHVSPQRIKLRPDEMAVAES